MEPVDQTLAAYASLPDRIDLLLAEWEAVTDNTRVVNERLKRGETVTLSVGGPGFEPLPDRAMALLREAAEALR